jgi:hypothetical protein
MSDKVDVRKGAKSLCQGWKKMNVENGRKSGISNMYFFISALEMHVKQHLFSHYY